MLTLTLEPQKTTTLTSVAHYQGLSSKALLKQPPCKVDVKVVNRPLIKRTLKNPIAIAVRYTNHNDLHKKELKTSFLAHVVDDYTEDEIGFPQFHPATGHEAVQILAWMNINKYVKFKEELWKDLGTGLVDWRET